MFMNNSIIDVSVLRRNNRQLADGLIQPATTQVVEDIVEEHDAEPIKNLEDISRISDYFLAKGKYRDNMLFILGINFGLRISDLRTLRFGNLINDNFTFKDKFPVFEKKTRNTRKKKVNRYITINIAVIEAVTTYLEHTPGVTLSDCMFVSESTNGTRDMNKPISSRSVNRTLKTVAKDLGLNMRLSTHSLRKTFCYHQMLMSHNDSRKLMLLQKMLNHSSPMQTLTYIGITYEEIEQAYSNLNLGSKEYNYLVNSDLVEIEELVG